MSISNDIVSTKIYDKRGNLDFEIVNFPLLDGDVTRSTLYGVYISQLIRFARASRGLGTNYINISQSQKLREAPRLLFGNASDWMILLK